MFRGEALWMKALRGAYDNAQDELVAMSFTPQMIFNLLLAFLGIAAGNVAAVTGFGIGSILTPPLAAKIGMKSALQPFRSHTCSDPECASGLCGRR